MHILLFIFLTLGAAWAAPISHAENASCVPDNTIRSDPGLVKIYDAWRTRLDERIQEMQENKKIRTYWGRSYETPTAIYGLYWIDGLDPFGVDIVRNHKGVIINASSVTSERTYKPSPKKAKPVPPKKKPKRDNQEETSSEPDPGRTELHISMDLGSARKKATNCRYEIRGAYIYVKLDKPVEGAKTDFGSSL